MKGVPRQLAGRALRSNLFSGKKPLKSIYTLIPNATQNTQDYWQNSIKKHLLTVKFSRIYLIQTSSISVSLPA